MSELLAAGPVRKMIARLERPVQYRLPLGADEVPMNALLGRGIRLRRDGPILCKHCGRETRKSFNQGYCYPCFTKLAQCDACIMSPEKCHYRHGTCREPEWGEAHCMIEHVVYLANTSGLKVGITRASQVPTRWMDQGAVQALPIHRVRSRYQSGCVEVAYKKRVTDRTNWQALLKGPGEAIDLRAEAARLRGECGSDIAALQEQFGAEEIQDLPEAEAVAIDYPLAPGAGYPAKIKSHNLDRDEEIAGQLLGIKGQYLIMDTGVINMRKYGGYQIALHAD